MRHGFRFRGKNQPEAFVFPGVQTCPGKKIPGQLKQRRIMFYGKDKDAVRHMLQKCTHAISKQRGKQQDKGSGQDIRGGGGFFRMFCRKTAGIQETVPVKHGKSVSCISKDRG